MSDKQDAVAYEAPVLVRLGSLEQLTQQNVRGGKLDAAFQSETPVPALTFS